MQTSYSIEVNIKTIKGYVAFCHYQLEGIGKDAEKIFACMKGSAVDVWGHAPFQLNLISHNGEKAITLASQYCTLADLQENSHYISLEVFKILNLE
ncbi:hypothetical protein [Filimonas effusa]|uniref:Uncharacterized protein n=1 Tax=Filimonas effusa TaxID=2508721 RepID=A0A4Q1D0R4_9BACT|nr:hypothetical protein [Filimonas effusa]RXK80814.1 hypothetical protein ESB13_21895 [Filimonas effusa]